MGRAQDRAAVAVPVQAGRDEDPPGGDDRGWRRNESDLAHDQLRGIEQWTRTHGVRAAATRTASATREARLDLSRRSETRRLEHEALMSRANDQLVSGARLLRHAPQAVLAHRNAWFTGKVADRLVERGVEVVAVVEDGASASGALVVEQPELLLVEDRLPVLSGLEVVERARAFAPATLTAVQLMDSTAVLRFQDAGACAVFARRVPPREVADVLADCVFGRRQQVLVL